MIISRQHSFIFVAIPKTGTHAVRQALREQMGREDLEQVSLFVQKKLPFPELARLRHGHITLQQVRPHLDADDFSSYFKFAFVRNPFDRYISYCAFVTRKHGTFDRDPKGVMRHCLFVAPPHQHLLFQPQHSFVVAQDGQLLADYIGRVEQMQQSYDEICEKLRIPSRPLDKVNASKRGSYRDYYDQQLIDGIAKLYARDLELFGYDF
jgi:hypothetical protein